jgi:peptide/nickel transport system permease protein
MTEGMASRARRRGGALGSLEGRLGVALVLLLVLVAAGGMVLAGQDPNRIDVHHRFAPPSSAHWFGTDQLGRDFFARIVFGTRIALMVALSVTGIAAVLGTLLGILAASGPRPVQRLLLAVFDVLGAFPSLILALAVVAVTGPGLATVVLVISLTQLPQYGRVARAQALAVRQAPFIETERVLGAGPLRIAFVHVLPNILGPLIVLASMDVPSVITIEAALSFIGAGVRPPLASWGTLLHEGYEYLDRSLWPSLFAGGALAAATLGFTFLGEGLRQAIDPKFDPDPR